MAKYRCYAIATASKFLGEVEADSKEEAQLKAEELDAHIGICHHCAGEVEIGDVTDIEVEEEDA